MYKFGKKIFDKIKDVMQPQFEDEDKVNPFDFWKGADFKLKIRNVAGYRNYDKSEFGSISNMLDNDDELESIWNNEYSLTEFLDPKNFKSYDELKQKLEMVLSGSGSTMKRAEEIDLQERSRPAPQPVKEVDTSKDEDESLSYFAKLANED